MFRKIRIAALLLILLVVALNSWLDQSRSQDWSRTLRVVVYPINGDGSHSSAQYISTLKRESLLPIETFFKREGLRYGLALRNPVDLQLAPEVKTRPPALPRERSVLNTMWWSLKMRYWAYSADNYQGPAPEVRMFVLYFDPRQHPRLDHSVGLKKGLLGVVKAFAGTRQAARNNVVIAHELLHTVGASDKYDPRTNLPLYPQGYADPGQRPLYPQRRAEIMAGRIPLSDQRAVIPASLEETLIGASSAREINWLVND